MKNMREMFAFDAIRKTYCVRWDVSDRKMQFHYARDDITNREELEAGRRDAHLALQALLDKHGIEESALVPLPLPDYFAHRPSFALDKK